MQSAKPTVKANYLKPNLLNCWRKNEADGNQPEFSTRNVNEGFSGGEKKRNEILQMAVLNPELALLDETDSGLDIDAMRIVARGVNQLMHPEMGLLLITHYQRLLDYISPLCPCDAGRQNRPIGRS